MFDHWCIVLCNGYFEGTEIYAVKLWVKAITEGQETAYFPINNPSIKKISYT